METKLNKMTKLEKLLEKINNEKHLYDIYHSVNSNWIDMELEVALATYHTASFEDTMEIVEYASEGMDIEEALFDVVQYDWFRDHCSGSEYLNDELCSELMESY